ncbi:MAG: DUF4199 domain-containing protein [Pseudomonadales bacterium]
MKKPAVVYGVISGSIAIVGIVATIVFDVAYQWLGYLIMLISFTAIYIAMRRFREEIQGGVLRFATGLQFGIFITLIASLVYTAGWELYLFLTDYSFVGAYIDSVIEAQQVAGVDEAEIEELTQDMEILRDRYGNILFRSALSLVEIFPVGLLISLLSASLLRK